MEFLLLCTLVFASGAVLGKDLSHDVMEEGRRIQKRFADSDNALVSHDVAHVLHEHQPAVFHRISKRDLRSAVEQETEKQIRLDLSSGSSFSLALKKRSLFAPDTKFAMITKRGRIESEEVPDDCYATGSATTHTGSEGLAAVALCDGLHGSFVIDGTEYYLHPVDAVDGTHQVHVFFRNLDAPGTDAIFGTPIDFVSETPDDQTATRSKRSAESGNATQLVIEMAVHADAKYYALMKTKAPGRENEFILYSMAGAQALYSNVTKVGYDVIFKIKLLEYWEVDPDGYEFKDSLAKNLGSYCRYANSKYPKYDLYFINSGVTSWENPAGLAYYDRICSSTADCASQRMTVWNRVIIDAHEIGHVLGFAHHQTSPCPEDIKNLGGGFMGGGNNFSPCNKWELQKRITKGAACLFKEKVNATSSAVLDLSAYATTSATTSTP